ncbi:MAG TPA: F0F1 ATP synthase subunit gamma [Beijerinckiaceae bacterium]|jgi:F-type H+-transporting ATPase subunit gamma|nr:F0F1 ATP synthase subunit gamma [Beijerinckiaceae bacterium]
MPSLKDLRNRIASVKATQKITKAMQMVAAAKLRRAQSAAEAARPYAQRMAQVLGNLAAGIVPGPETPRLLSGTGADRVHLLVVCTAERGLCGAFNSSIARLARDHVNRLLGEGKDVKIICVGKKGYDILRRQFGQRIIDFVDLRGAKQIGFEHADGIAQNILQRFEAGEFDVATLFYSRFKSVISQIPTAHQIIPAQIEAGGGGSADTVYDYEPDESEILGALLPRNLTVQIFRALLENAASEQGARMSAMDNATRNAGDMIRKQTTLYNRTRQAQITKELIEIISGAEAL